MVAARLLERHWPFATGFRSSREFTGLGMARGLENADED